MAGNHHKNRFTHEHWMVVALVLVVWWSTLEAWRPWETHLPGQTASQATVGRYCSARRSAKGRLCDFAAPPYYRWLVESSGVGPLDAGEAALRDGPPTIVAPSPVSEELVKDWWMPLAASQPTMSPSDWRQALSADLLSLDLRAPMSFAPARVNRFTQATEVGKELDAATGGDASWMLAGCDTAGWWWEVGRELANLSTPRRSAGASRGRSVSSPPALLSRPLVSDFHERLAMLQRPARPLAAPSRESSSHGGNSLDAVVRAARPYFAESLDRAIQAPMFAEPTSLVSMIRDLSHEPGCALWAGETLRILDALATEDGPSTNRACDSLARLADLSQDAEELALETDNPGLATRLRRARYGVWRRYECWQAAYALVAPPLDRLTLANSETKSSEFGTSDTAHVASPPAPPVAINTLLADIESYESHGRKICADRIASQLQQLSRSGDARRRALADSIEVHYRNANARVAIAGELVNRWMPTDAPRTEAIEDRILGTPVRGKATTQTHKTITLLPDESAWRLGLELTGEAESHTIALERTVKVRTEGMTRFTARQQVVVNPWGIHSGEVQATAVSRSQFVGATSKYDPFPVVGEMVRSRAASAFDHRRGRAQQEVADKAAKRVERDMVNTVAQAVAHIEARFRARFTGPLSAAGVAVEPVEMQTTDRRLVARVRIDHAGGLTAHTPRPRAPSDSLASLQLHETGVANLAGGLQLDGARLTAPQLAGRLARLAPDRAEVEWDDDAENSVIEFADHEAVGVELAEGKAHVTLAVREMVVRNRPHRNFKVHVYYTPQAEGVALQFAHTDGPFFEGNLRNSERIRLQTIFGKVFRQDSEFRVGQRFADDPRLAELMITQLVIDDGWLAVALGPDRPLRTAQLDRYAPLR